MCKRTVDRATYLILGFITISICSFLFWDHFHGGVPSHHFLANDELPKISNWWGLISVPVISYLLLNNIKTRIKSESDQIPVKFIKKECYSFLIGTIYAIMLALSFTYGYTQISSLLFLGLPAIALFFPIYHPSYLLGFLVGMMYTFGGVLPIFIGGVMSIICYFIFIIFHPILIKIINKISFKIS
jgi:hypothetical protein